MQFKHMYYIRLCMFTMLGVNIEFPHVHIHPPTHTHMHENTKHLQTVTKPRRKNRHKHRKKKKSIYRIPVFSLSFGGREWRFCWEKNGWNKKNKPSVFFKKTRCCLQVKSCISLYRNRERKKDLIINYSRLGVQDLDGVHFFSWNYIVPLNCRFKHKVK